MAPDEPPPASPHGIDELCEGLRCRLPQILADWEAIVDEEAGQALPGRHRLSELGDVVLRLAHQAAHESADRESRSGALATAADHGSALRAHGMPDDIMFTEFTLLRRAIWYHLQGAGAGETRATEAIARIDEAITLTTMAALHGYHRRELESLGRWPAAIHDLAS